MKQRLVVEIGHGEEPLWHRLRKMPLEDQHYVGLDIKQDRWPSEDLPFYHLDDGRREIMGKSRCTCLHIGQGGALPLDDGSSAETYILRVVNDPRLDTDAILALLREASRITAPEGYIIIDNGNGATGNHDVLVDHSTNKAAFKMIHRLPIMPEDISNPVASFLNEGFVPMESGIYKGFLAERGLPKQFPMEPGVTFSILQKL